LQRSAPQIADSLAGQEVIGPAVLEVVACHLPTLRERRAGSASKCSYPERDLIGWVLPFGVPECRGSCDEVGLVGHASGPSAAHTDEYAFVQPIEVGGGGLDPRRGTEGIQAGVDLLAAAETCEYVGGAVSDTS
jgi:hypothetical protein